MPAYNAGNFILDALDSIAQQSRFPQQIIVVDDGSTDGTAGLAQRWSASKGIPIDLIRQENKGVPVARNRGIKACTGDWIALLDADDLYLPDHLAEMERAIAARPDIVAAFGDGVIFDSTGTSSAPFSRQKALATANSVNADGVHILGEKLYCSLLSGNYVMPSSLLVKRLPVVEMGMFDESLRFIEDRDFLLRLSKKGNFAFVDRVTVKARKHEGNITHPKNTTRNTRFALRVLDKSLANSAALGLSEAEIQSTRAELHHTIRQLLYSASLDGLKAYAEAVLLLLSRPFAVSMLNPTHLFRALYYTFRK